MPPTAQSDPAARTRVRDLAIRILSELAELDNKWVSAMMDQEALVIDGWNIEQGAQYTHPRDLERAESEAIAEGVDITHYEGLFGGVDKIQ